LGEIRHAECRRIIALRPSHDCSVVGPQPVVLLLIILCRKLVITEAAITDIMPGSGRWRQLHRQTAQLHHIICPTYLSVSIWQSKQSITAIRIKLFKVHKHDYGENLHDWNTCIGCIKGDFCTWAEYATSGPNFDVTIRNKSSVSGSRWPED